MIPLIKEAALQLSVGPIRDLWPLLLLPAVAALARDRLLTRPAEHGAAAAAQTVLLAAPGALALVLIAFALVDSFPPDKALRWSIAWTLAPIMGVALLSFAAVRLAGRLTGVRRLFGASAAPRPALAALGRDLGLRIREIETDEPASFVAGFLKPTAFVSRSVPDRLSEAELIAVLLHERAHARAFDTLRLLALFTLSDLRPLGGRRAMASFVAGLERRADVAAARACAPSDLAAAILRLAGAARQQALVLPVADPSHMRWRLGRLLADDEDAAPRAGLRTVLAAGVTASLLAWPAVQLALHRFYCQG